MKHDFLKICSIPFTDWNTLTHRGYYLDSGGLYHPTQLFPLFFPFSIHTMRQGQGLAVTVITAFAVPVLVTSPTFYFIFPLYFSRRYQGFWILDFGFWILDFGNSRKFRKQSRVNPSLTFSWVSHSIALRCGWIEIVMRFIITDLLHGPVSKTRSLIFLFYQKT